MRLRARLLALIAPMLLSAALLGACSDSEGAEPGATGAPSEPTLPAGSGANPPAGIPLADVPGTTATANGKTVEMGIGTYCWTSMCVDKTGAVTKGALDVSRGDIVEVAVPQGTPPLREISATAFQAGTPVNGDNGEQIWPFNSDTRDLSTGRDGTKVEVDVDLPPGTWILTVGMYFERGDIAYGVVLNVR
jgi:hypothetical protein